MKRFLTAAAVSVTLFAAGCSSDSDPALQATTPTTSSDTITSTIEPVNSAFSNGSVLGAAGGFSTLNGLSALASWCIGDCSTVSPGEIVIGDNGNEVYSHTITNAEPNSPWNVTLQKEVTLSASTNYVLTFKARSDRSRSIAAGIGRSVEPFADNDQQSVQLTDSWETYSVTLNSASFGGTQNRVFFELAGEAGLVMIDEVSIVESATTTPTLAQVALPVDFEGSIVDYTLNDFEGAVSELVVDPTDASNMVIRTVKDLNAGAYAGTTIGNTANSTSDQGFASVIPFTATATTMSVRVYSPDSGIPVRLKVERSDDNSITAETDTYTTLANEWETLVFDLNMIAAGTASFDASAGYDKASIFFNVAVNGNTAGEKTYYWDDVAFGDPATTTPPTSTATEPETAPAQPVQAVANVKSLFSDTYTTNSVDVSEFSTSWDKSDVSDFIVEGNAAKKFVMDVVPDPEPNPFVGINFDNDAVNGTAYTNLKMDVWSPDITTLQVRLVDFNGTGWNGGADNSEGFKDITLSNGSWVSVDIPLTDFLSSGMNGKTELSQILLKATGFNSTATLFVDNLYFYDSASAPTPVNEPLSAAATPTQAEADVKSLFSDYSTNVVNVGEFSTSWDKADVSDFSVEANTSKKYVMNVDPDPEPNPFVGINFDNDAVNGTAYTNLKMDVWSPDITTLQVRLVDFNGTGWNNGADNSEGFKDISLSNGSWVSIDIPLTDFLSSGMNGKTELSQILLKATSFNTTATLFMDNLYFYSSGSVPVSANEPSSAAVPPTHADADVKSLFGDYTTNVVGVGEFSTGWDKAEVSDFSVEANTSKKYVMDVTSDPEPNPFVGINFDSDAVNGTAYTNLKMDVWSPDITTLQVRLVDFNGTGWNGGADNSEGFKDIALSNGSWVSIDIPLTDFLSSGMNGKTELAQILLKATGFDTSATLYMDNLYFY